MPRLSGFSILALAFATMLAPAGTGRAADAGRTTRGADAGRAAAPAQDPHAGLAAAPAQDPHAGLAAAPAQDPHAGLGLPPGHPSLEGDETESDGDDSPEEGQLPPGHPPTTARNLPQPLEGRLPEDLSETDTELPPGVIVVEVRDRNEQPVAQTDVNLGILQQSVAKGESRRHLTRRTDEAGVVRFDGLESKSEVAYRVTIPWGTTDERATYAAAPFLLNLQHGQRVRIHVLPMSNSINDVLVGMEVILYVELKDDALQFEQLLRVYNVGGVTWVPKNLIVPLPRGFRAFNAQREMSDIGYEEAPGQGAKMRGTFTPGQHQTEFRYQLPYDGEESVDISFNLPPRVARVRVMAEASKNMELRVDGFGKAASDRNGRGQRILVTERQVRQGEQALARLHMSLTNIPTEGSSKWVATAIAAATVALGLYFASQQAGSAQKRRDPHESERARTRLVAEIAALERAHRAGEVGPSAYARIHEALVDSLARLFPAGES